MVEGREEAMNSTRKKAVQVLESIGLDMESIDLSKEGIYHLLDAVRELEESQQQSIVAELATGLSLKLFASTGPFYHEFEGALWAHFVETKDLQDHVSTTITTNEFGANATRIYYAYLRSMFEAYGNKRDELCRSKIVEAKVREDIDNTDFGEKALNFLRKVRGSVHMEHLLVLYSIALFLGALEELGLVSCSASEDELNVVFHYFESLIP